MSEVWEGEGRDRQLLERQSFWSEDCQFCPDEILAEEFENCFLKLEDMIIGVRTSEKSPNNRKFKKAGSITPTLIIENSALKSSEGFLSDLYWIKGVVGHESIEQD